MWTQPDFDNPPHWVMVGLWKDGSGAIVLSKVDNDVWRDADDGYEYPTNTLVQISLWTPAPDDFRPHFMEVTDEDFY